MWTQLRYHQKQSELFRCKEQFVTVVAGRGSGKSDISRRRLVVESVVKKPWEDPLYFYVLPTFSQAKRVGWEPLLRLFPKEWIAKNGINKTDLSITTVIGSKVYVVGADKPQRLEGVQADMVIVDESSDQRPGLFSKSIEPMLTHRQGKGWRIGIPKKSGPGKAEFKAAFLNTAPSYASFHWKTVEVLTECDRLKVEAKKDTMDLQTYLEQYEAVWVEGGGSVYYSFCEGNKNDTVQYNPTREICVGCDFNVSPMCWVLAHFDKEAKKLEVFDELYLKDTNTPASLDALIQKYHGHLAGWRFFGDASSRHRKTSAPITDYYHIKNDMRFGNKKVIFPNRNPPVRDRIASVNSVLRSANDTIRCFINTSCRRLIGDLETVAYQEGKNELEDYRGTDIGHTVDSFGYMVHTLMPLKVHSSDSVPSIFTVGAA